MTLDTLLAAVRRTKLKCSDEEVGDMLRVPPSPPRPPPFPVQNRGALSPRRRGGCAGTQVSRALPAACLTRAAGAEPQFFGDGGAMELDAAALARVVARSGMKLERS